MSKLILITAYIWIFWLMRLDYNTALEPNPLDDFDTSKVMVGFNPYVSILDIYNYSRYGIAELVPLFEKVATRFNRVNILLSMTYFNSNYTKLKSLLQSPLAAAAYNCKSTTKNKLEVFLEVRHNSEICSCNTTEFYENLQPIIALADSANTLCKGTVTTILLKYCPSAKCSLKETARTDLSEVNNYQPNYLWGWSVPFYKFCNGDINNLDQHFNVDVMNFLFENLHSYLVQNSTDCKYINNSFRIIKTLVPSEVGKDPKTNQSTLVSTWKSILTQPSDIYLLSLAFDNHDDQYYYGNGWWYLLNDPGSTNTSKFVFQEKILNSIEMDKNESSRNYQWLQKERKFNKDNTGIVSRDPTDFTIPEFTSFCKITLIVKYNVSDIKFLLKLTHDRFGNTTCQSVQHVYIFPILEDPAFQFFYNVSVHTIDVVDWSAQTKTRYGYAYPMDICARFPNPNVRPENFLEQLSHQNISLIMFYFVEDERSIEVGSTRLVRQRIVLFEKCREIVQSTKRPNMEIVFVPLGYPNIHNKFYYSVEQMQEYVKYVYLLSHWAEKQVNIVICIGLFRDTKIQFDLSAAPQVYVGFYSYISETGVYISKRTQALELSKQRFPDLIKNTTNIEKPTSFNTSQFLIIFSILALVSLVIVLLTNFLIRRHYKNNILTRNEIGDFFKGETLSENDIQKSSYDKERYEISNEKFKVETDIILGSGEFGTVYRGIIDTISGNIHVAVKTPNQQNFHKTQLTGLLSEIKVMAYIGKHENIIELLGANTSSLEKGTVYIFLEFCQLGSLIKFLRDTRLLINTPIQETNVDTITNENSYVNTYGTFATTLDSALSDDLYRWSTEICNGMTYLAEKHVVHADLATRNVLLNLRREAKICDFGLSRRMYNYANYVRTKQEPLPWKWMAPESLRDMQFNEKTDVWAYGVTLWEIYSMGSSPFAGLSWDANFSQMLERGLRLSEPEYCERNMYEIMKKCWTVRPEHRPSFSEILEMVKSSVINHPIE